MEIITKENTPDRIKLSIQVRLNGLSFCTINSNKEILWYKKKDFPKEFDPVKVLNQMEELFKSEKELQQSIDEVVVLFSNELYSFVPLELFKEEEASHYLKFNTKILKTDVVAHDVISNLDLVNVFIPYTNINNYLFDKFGEFEFKHSISVLVQSVLNLPAENAAAIYVNVFSGYYDLVVVKNNQLLMSNTFSYETREDFIYYLLFSAEQLQLDPEEFELYLLGNIDENSPLYDVCYTYIKNLKLFDPNINLPPNENFEENFQREAYILLKSLECE
jgi:hypothetical protein